MSTDAERLNALWDAYAHRVQAYAMRHVDPDTAAEVVSETFLIAWRRLADVPGEPMPWLLVVARNTIRNAYRSRYRARALADELARIADVLPPVAEAAEDVALERDALLRGLAALTPREREALLLTSWDGLAAADAARVAGCSVSAFQVRLHRARRRLRAALHPDDDADGRSRRADPRAHAVIAWEGD
ncbi:RNA polymerase sigma-70 factor (ECF subfamily) [Salana multivorans]|uniref:RNA polymerase sigma-70 factor (ECF subfamily) n=1 Tax=Salana multivorans TaxID=120377 RepID=A0A3N2DBC1_9MICO|nr:sigma-70 family RNA polymerase sigma factor [Salana multivorans]ROR97056.1 RNA polymerase sigma-70 factor (ECF subfamily) [Salana multivorans]